MLVIDNVQYSKNPVKTGETFILSVQVSELLATWGDVKTQTTYAQLYVGNWESVKLKIFRQFLSWATTKSRVYSSIKLKSWKDVKSTNQV